MTLQWKRVGGFVRQLLSHRSAAVFLHKQQRFISRLSVAVCKASQQANQVLKKLARLTHSCFLIHEAVPIQGVSYKKL